VGAIIIVRRFTTQQNTIQMKLAIIGSRTFNDYNLVQEELNAWADQITKVISGGAKGADQLGEQWANSNNIDTQIFKPEWDKYGRAAGVRRNEDIIKNSDVVIAFWDGQSKGTASSISLARKHNKRLRIVKI
jgi:hypothetical protein